MHHPNRHHHHRQYWLFQRLQGFRHHQMHRLLLRLFRPYLLVLVNLPRHHRRHTVQIIQKLTTQFRCRHFGRFLGRLRHRLHRRNHLLLVDLLPRYCLEKEKQPEYCRYHPLDRRLQLIRHRRRRFHQPLRLNLALNKHRHHRRQLR